MLFQLLAQNRHKTGDESVVFSSIYMRAIKNQLAAQLAQNELRRWLPL